MCEIRGSIERGEGVRRECPYGSVGSAVLHDRPDSHASRCCNGLNSGVQVSRDGQDWHIGTASDVGWIACHTTAGVSITTAIPPVFDAYATTCQTDDVTVAAYEHALVENLSTCTPDQPWWLAYLDTGAHDVVLGRREPRGCFQAEQTEPGPRTLWGRTGCSLRAPSLRIRDAPVSGGRVGGS